MPSQPEVPVKPGDVLDGKYRVERVLGVGGMGVVVQARHIDLNTRVALKFMLPEALKDAENVQRFQREARAAVRLRSDHTARVLDVGRMKNGAPYMVMEFLVGQDLGQLLEGSGAMPVFTAFEYILQACEAIAEAHAVGIVHRDLKPRNLFLARRVDGRPLIKVLDFGLAKTLDSTQDHALTRTTAVMGSPQYMSPEQMRASRSVDARSDIWSLGVCLYELLTGVVPFDAPTVPELCALVLKDPPRPPHEVRPDIPYPLSMVVMRCLEKDASLRFPDIALLAEALERFGSVATQGAAGRVRSVLTTTPAITDSEAPPPPLSATASSLSMQDSRFETRTAASFDSRRKDTRSSTTSLRWVGAGAALASAVVIAVVGLGVGYVHRRNVNAAAGAEHPSPPPPTVDVAPTAPELPTAPQVTPTASTPPTVTTPSPSPPTPATAARPAPPRRATTPRPPPAQVTASPPPAPPPPATPPPTAPKKDPGSDF
jgi:eukaryotic-like serine/threonine-protein kinase